MSCTPDEPIVLPGLTYPFASSVQASLFAADVDASCYLWGQRMEIFGHGDPQEYRRTRVGWLAALTCPRGTRVGLQLLADWQMWLFAFDDAYCDESEHGSRPDALVARVVSLLTVLDGAEPASDDPFARALADLSARLNECARGFQRARFVSAAQGYFLAQCREAVNRAQGVLPGLAEYMYMRRHSGAVPTCMSLIDVAGGFQLQAEEYDEPDVVALTAMAVDIACWANDIISYPKETRRSLTVHSLPVILAYQQGLGRKQALDATARLHDQQVACYLRAEHKVRSRASPALSRYLDDLRFWMTGNLQWSRDTGRYRDPLDTTAADQPGGAANPARRQQI
jgi:hypothetical protein